jgi:hypothetical protein
LLGFFIEDDFHGLDPNNESGVTFLCIASDKEEPKRFHILEVLVLANLLVGVTRHLLELLLDGLHVGLGGQDLVGNLQVVANPHLFVIVIGHRLGHQELILFGHPGEGQLIRNHVEINHSGRIDIFELEGKVVVDLEVDGSSSALRFVHVLQHEQVASLFLLIYDCISVVRLKEVQRKALFSAQHSYLGENFLFDRFCNFVPNWEAERLIVYQVNS